MTLLAFINLFKRLKASLKKVSIGGVDEPTVDKLVIKTLTLSPNPRYQGNLWGYRPTSMIDKIIVHQELGEGDTVSVHNYHISKQSHLKLGVGAPKIAYHFTIEKDGTVYQVNKETDVVWHCKGQNMKSIGIMLCGDFSGPSHVGHSTPTEAQLAKLDQLLDHIRSEFSLKGDVVHGHCDFGKENCPGTLVEIFLEKYRRDNSGKDSIS